MHTVHNRRVGIRIKAPIATGVIFLIKSLADFNHSSSLAAEVFREVRGNNDEDNRLIEEFKALTESIRVVELDKLSAQSTSINNFLLLCEAIATPDDYLKLQTIILHFAPLYRQIFRSAKTETWLKQELKSFKEVAQKLQFENKLSLVSKLFDTHWNYRIPFTIALIPLPNREGGTHGSSSNSIQFCEIKEGNSLVESMDVIFHEICHSYFHKQSETLDQALCKAFGDLDANVAYFLLNEGLATAVSQGWFEKERLGKLPDNRWYNYEYIDGYAKDLYPLILPFIERKQTLNASFADNAIAAFKKKFPGKLHNPALLMWNVVVVDAQNGEFRQQLEELVPQGNFRYSASPLDSEGSQLFFSRLQQLTGVIAARRSDLPLLQTKYFPQLDLGDLLDQAPKSPSQEGLFWCRRINNRWVFIFVGETVEEQTNALKRLLTQETIPAN